ncbi:uncharacterized protein EKO05_0008573 [Ascochyta rabiei]|uniref:Transferase n=1 Tax=Didymella rabiei TaxID=5454 RepID=A0A163FW85_DIDRA|nr:uncharacterized protein EKO05_0008573 [Ascochyta rabiei]KZM24565.1 transferase [Ascochyta rabiei]UPX18269.1 hypothetical protein EKO05_0008573 [Ascochyta rabiei]
MLRHLRSLLKATLRLGLPILAFILIFHFLEPLNKQMPPSPSQEVASTLLAENGLDLLSISLLQSLWAGYGQICHVTAADGLAPDFLASLPGNLRDPLVKEHRAKIEKLRKSSKSYAADSTPQHTHSFILKLITPPPTRAGDEGHTRKILSYQVEQYFYSHLAPQLPASVFVAKCLASINKHHSDGTSTTAMIMRDLKQEFPVAGEKRGSLSRTQVKAALDWLSGFHGFWWPRVGDLDRTKLVLPPLEEVMHDGQDASGKTVWLNGGYTYLATRRKEYDGLANDYESEWREVLTEPSEGQSRSISEMVAAFLAPSVSGHGPIEQYQTLIHGDVKSENLFTSESGEEVAFYDFQYTGLGLGACDLAKLFTCSVPLSMLVIDEHVPRALEMQDGEKQLLERYWKKLKDTSKKEYAWEIFVQHWEIALVDWLRFQASWGFWGNTEWLEARVRSILMDKKLKTALQRSTGRT